jgi:pSer/pThr/pTyr-binding forkhead associated (FHA) protein
MPRIVLKELESERSFTITEADFLIGRDPASGLVVDGPKSKVVSGRHAHVFVQDGGYWIEDISRNGTVVDHERLQRGVRHALSQGQIIGLGDTGPRFSIESLDIKFVAQTMMEPAPVVPPPTAAPPASPTAPQPAMPAKRSAPAPSRPQDAATVHVQHSEADRSRAQAAAAEPSTEPMGPAPDWIVHIVMRETHTSQRYDVRGDVIKIGRAPVCLVQIPAETGASVSRVHAEVLIQDGGVTLKDAGSRNGTFHNGKRMEGPAQVTKGDVVMLGAGGPSLHVEDLHIVKGDDRTRSTAGEPGSGSGPGNRVTPDSPHSSRGTAPGGMQKFDSAPDAARRRTASFSDVLESTSATTAHRRFVLWGAIGAIAIAAAVVGTMQAGVAPQDRLIETDRAAFEARSDSIRRIDEAEARRLRATFDSARVASAPRQMLDSLRDALADATRKVGDLSGAMARARQSLAAQLANADSEQLRAIRSANLARVAQLNQGAVGLVTAFSSTAGSQGSGFAISPSGFFVTNRHVVTGAPTPCSEPTSFRSDKGTSTSQFCTSEATTGRI